MKNKSDTKRTDEAARNVAKKKYVPTNYGSAEDFLSEMRANFRNGVDADRDNRDAALEDLLFVAGQQWDEQVKARRQRENKPCMTVNRMPAMVGQVIGNRRMNEAVIKVTPDVGGDKEVAQIRQGLIRSIEKTSKADRAYNNAFQNTVMCGIGNFGVSVDYAYDDVFDQDIKVYTIPNALAVVWDDQSSDPTGADAEFCFVVEEMDKDGFEKLYPDAVIGDLYDSDSALTSHFNDSWMTEDTVRVVHYWQMKYEDRELWLMTDGRAVDVTDYEDEQLDALLVDVALDEATGEPYSRMTRRSKAVCHICTANSILEGPVELPIKRVPVFRIPGWEIDTGFSKQRYGLVRWMKDPQRMLNYWRSIVVEKLMLTPKAPWVASKEAIAGYEREWRNAHLSNDTVLIYNGDAGSVPSRTPPAQMETALIQESAMSAQDMKDVTNIHEATMGMTSNEVSGRAILARQKMGEVGSVIFLENEKLALEEAGAVINDLIPVVYDVERTIKIIDVEETGDEQERLVAINSVVDEDSVDITTGKYTITVHTGPSQVTRRLEAQEGMLNMVNAMPELMQIAAPEIVEAQDWPGASKIAKRLRKQLGQQDEGDMSPEEQQAAQQAALAAQKQEQMAEAMFTAELQEKQAKALEMQARAEKAKAEIRKMAMETVIEMRRVANEEDKTEIDAVKVAAEIEAMDINGGATAIEIARKILEMERSVPNPDQGV